MSLVVSAALDRKALDLVVLDMTQVAAFTDFFIICHGRSRRQVQGISDRVEEKLKQAGIRPNHIEGYTGGEWILMDYVGLVIHVFVQDRRKYYDLEKLWVDAPRMELPPDLREPPSPENARPTGYFDKRQATD